MKIKFFIILSLFSLPFFLFTFIGCNQEPLDLEQYYVLYEETFGMDPILVDDPFFEPPNKKLMYQYPKATYKYSSRPREFSTKDIKYLRIGFDVYFKIDNPIDFFANRETMDSIGWNICSNCRDLTYNFFSNMTEFEIITLYRNNQLLLNNNYFNYVRGDALLDIFGDEIKGISLERIDINIEAAEVFQDSFNNNGKKINIFERFKIISEERS